MALEIACALGDANKFTGAGGVNARFMNDDLRLNVVIRIAEVQRTETLFGRLLEVLQYALVTGIVGNHQLKIPMGGDVLILFIERQHASRVGERMDHDGCVLARFHHFVQITDRAIAHGQGERAILPMGARRIEQKTAD